MQISSFTTFASAQHGNTLRIENIGSTLWKLLCSSSGHAHDDGDEYHTVKITKKCLIIIYYRLKNDSNNTDEIG